MCFSATSSFAASGMLASIGILSLLSVKRASAYPRALIPLFFAAQQTCEGIIWITYGSVAYASIVQFATIGFLIFAQIVWPIWMPLSLFVAERNRSRALILGILTLCGIGFGVLSAQMLYQYPIGVQIMCHSIAYTYGNLSRFMQYLCMGCYLCVTVVPFFVSTLAGTTIIGGLITLGFAVAWWSFYMTFGSVWCFFAALISSLIFLQLRLER